MGSCCLEAGRWRRGCDSMDAMPHDATMTQPPSEEKHTSETPAGPIESLSPKVEAVLVSRSRPISAEAIARGLGLIGEDAAAGEKRAAGDEILRVVAALNEHYDQSSRSFRIEKVAGGLRLVTLSDFAAVLEAFNTTETSSRLSRPAIETLAIIAYRQPVARAQIESIRGVACGEVLRSLLERRLIAVVGRAEELGRPMLYGTTRQFLQAFGLSTLEDLPQRDEGSTA